MHFILIKNKARNKIAISREEGRQQGKEEGLAECLEKGLEQGKLENQKQIALNMKEQGLKNDFIIKCLNISNEELEKLLNS